MDFNVNLDDIPDELDISEIEKIQLPKKNAQAKTVQNEYRFQSRFAISGTEYKFKIVKDIADIEKSDLPKANECLKIVTEHNLISARILNIIDVKSISVMFAVISKEGVEIFNRHKINNAIARADGDILLSPVAKNLKCELKRIRNHVKIILVESKTGDYYTINSSANPKISDKIEHYSIDNSKILYDYFTNTMKAI